MQTIHTVEIYHLFDDTAATTSKHKVSSMVELVRVIKVFGASSGHEIRISVPRACATDLGLRESGGSIWASAHEIAIGNIRG